MYINYTIIKLFKKIKLFKIVTFMHVLLPPDTHQKKKKVETGHRWTNALSMRSCGIREAPEWYVDNMVLRSSPTPWHPEQGKHQLIGWVISSEVCWYCLHVCLRPGIWKHTEWKVTSAVYRYHHHPHIVVTIIVLYCHHCHHCHLIWVIHYDSLWV